MKGNHPWVAAGINELDRQGSFRAVPGTSKHIVDLLLHSSWSQNKMLLFDLFFFSFLYKGNFVWFNLIYSYNSPVCILQLYYTSVMMYNAFVIVN